jgi:hypothetical protein
MSIVCELAQFSIRFYVEYFMSYLEATGRLWRPLTAPKMAVEFKTRKEVVLIRG